MTSWAVLNQEGHRICLAHKTTHTLSFSPALLNPILLLPIPDLHRGSAECQVQLQDQLSGIGVRSKLDSEKTEIHTPTPNRTMKQSSNPPSPGICNGSGWLPLWTTAIWANQRKQGWIARSLWWGLSLHGPQVDDSQAWQRWSNAYSFLHTQVLCCLINMWISCYL